MSRQLNWTILIDIRSHFGSSHFGSSVWLRRALRLFPCCPFVGPGCNCGGQSRLRGGPTRAEHYAAFRGNFRARLAQAGQARQTTGSCCPRRRAGSAPTRATPRRRRQVRLVHQRNGASDRGCSSRPLQVHLGLWMVWEGRQFRIPHQMLRLPTLGA